MSISECRAALNDAVAQLNPVLQPLGFRFVAEGSGEGHMPFASGLFVGSGVKIGIIFRSHGTLGCVTYENEHSNMSHDDLMRYLGVQSQQKLMYHHSSMASKARGGGDPIGALIDDLRERVGERLNDSSVMAQFIGRSLNERFPGLGGDYSLQLPQRARRGLIRRFLNRLGGWHSKK